jgi:hypothetical protein
MYVLFTNTHYYVVVVVEVKVEIVVSLFSCLKFEFILIKYFFLLLFKVVIKKLKKFKCLI